MIKITVIQPHGKGWYWTARITTDDGNNDVAASGENPRAAVMAAMELLPWLSEDRSEDKHELHNHSISESRIKI